VLRGNTGLCILQQVFVADASDLLNRALIGSVPYLITVDWTICRGRAGGEDESMVRVCGESYISPPSRQRAGWWVVADEWFLEVIVTPVVSMPLFVALWCHSRKTRKQGFLLEYLTMEEAKLVVVELRTVILTVEFLLCL